MLMYMTVICGVNVGYHDINVGYNKKVKTTFSPQLPKCKGWYNNLLHYLGRTVIGFILYDQQLVRHRKSHAVWLASFSAGPKIYLGLEDDQLAWCYGRSL